MTITEKTETPEFLLAFLGVCWVAYISLVWYSKIIVLSSSNALTFIVLPELMLTFIVVDSWMYWLYLNGHDYWNKGR